MSYFSTITTTTTTTTTTFKAAPLLAFRKVPATAGFSGTETELGSELNTRFCYRQQLRG